MINSQQKELINVNYSTLFVELKRYNTDLTGLASQGRFFEVEFPCIRRATEIDFTKRHNKFI